LDLPPLSATQTLKVALPLLVLVVNVSEALLVAVPTLTDILAIISLSFCRRK
jgi:hypothetical protein